MYEFSCQDLASTFRLAVLIVVLYSAVYDWKYRILPDYISLPIIVLGLIVALLQDNYSIYLIGFGMGFSILMAMALIGNTGGGDIKLAGALGITFGYPIIVVILLVGVSLGAIYGICKIIWSGIENKDLKTRVKAELDVRGNKNYEVEKERLPLGTFLVMGAWIVFII